MIIAFGLTTRGGKGSLLKETIVPQGRIPTKALISLKRVLKSMLAFNRKSLRIFAQSLEFLRRSIFRIPFLAPVLKAYLYFE